MYNSYKIPGSFNSSMNSSYDSYMSRPINNNSDIRFIGGGFLGPFLLGGITGGLVSPFFYGRRPYYNNNYYYPPYPPYPPYRPYYR